MHEPLIVVHRRMMRQRLVLMVIWIAGWVVAGLFAESHGYLATAILLVSGPGVWLVHYAWRWWRRPGEREPVTRRAPGSRALGGPGAGGSR